MTGPGEPRAPETPAALAIGDVVADRYRIDAVLGKGGMGIVYRVEHMHLRKPYALKVLLPLWSSMPEVVARFEREAVAAGRIQNPHVAAATDFGRLPSGSFFLVMEHVNGRTLRDALEGGAFDSRRALHILRGMVSALQAAHAVGIVHRDMKPENVMLIEQGGDADFVKVLDFGIAKVDEVGGTSETGPSRALTQVGAVIGTPDYMSPEQALGQTVDARSDLYSVGVILFEMFTGRCPFVGGAVTMLRQHILAEVPELPPEITSSVDPRMGAVLRRLLAKHPQDRFADTAELMAALEESWNERARSEPPSPSRPALATVEGTTTPAAQRERRSVLAGLVALEEAARSALADPKALLQWAMRRRLAITGLLAAGVGTMIIALVVWSGPRTAPSTAVAQATSRAHPRAGTDGATSATTLPLPPAPTIEAGTAERPASSGEQPARGKPASAPGQSHRTGPGGIYIPPPKTWFK
jgi:eukaryotic-like serine/threonine-protein kinase